MSFIRWTIIEYCESLPNAVQMCLERHIKASWCLPCLHCLASCFLPRLSSFLHFAMSFILWTIIIENSESLPKQSRCVLRSILKPHVTCLAFTISHCLASTYLLFLTWVPKLLGFERYEPSEVEVKAEFISGKRITVRPLVDFLQPHSSHLPSPHRGSSAIKV